MNVSSHYWPPFHTSNDCVLSRNEQQKVYYLNNIIGKGNNLLYGFTPKSNADSFNIQSLISKAPLLSQGQQCLIQKIFALGS